MELEALVQPFGVSIERIRVLHDELAHSQEPGARPRLVALLRAEVVPALRELLVRLDLPRVEGHRLFVRERQDEETAVPILQLEDLRDVDAAAQLPELRRRQHRTQHLLIADCVHLLADNLDDLLVHTPAERQERPQPCAHLPDEAAADEQLVARGLCVRRRLAQRRKK